MMFLIFFKAILSFYPYTRSERPKKLPPISLFTKAILIVMIDYMFIKFVFYLCYIINIALYDFHYGTLAGNNC